jgi:hypothetical protein
VLDDLHELRSNARTALARGDVDTAPRGAEARKLGRRESGARAGWLAAHTGLRSDRARDRRPGGARAGGKEGREGHLDDGARRSFSCTRRGGGEGRGETPTQSPDAGLGARRGWGVRSADHSSPPLRRVGSDLGVAHPRLRSASCAGLSAMGSHNGDLYGTGTTSCTDTLTCLAACPPNTGAGPLGLPDFNECYAVRGVPERGVRDSADGAAGVARALSSGGRAPSDRRRACLASSSY